jgi:CheY-like chemotaxis protein
MEKRNIQILIVEDNDFDYELAERNLKKTSLPYTFFFQRAQTEKEFRERLTNPTDIILSDFSLPKFSGLSALKIAHKEFPHIPFVFLSGTIGEELAVESMKQGAIDYVLKDRMNKLEPAIFRALNEANEKLKRKEAEEKLVKKHNELKEFVYRISHDIRGPICTMQGMVGLMRNDKDGNQEAYLDLFNEVLLKMDGTIGNLSNFQFLYSDQLTISRILKKYWGM